MLSMVISAVIAVDAAKVYNKDGNKLDLYGKVDGLHYFSSNSSKYGDYSYVRMGFKGETQINDSLTGYGPWEYQFNTNRTEDYKDMTDSPRSFTRLALSVFRLAMPVLSITDVITAYCMILVAGPICCLSLVMIPMKIPMIL